jgi:hypothetical protein
MVEFALVAPIFFALLLGIIEAGRFIFYYETLANAAREGARYAIVHGANSSCPSGPAPAGETNGCDPDGSNVKDAVTNAAFSIVGTGDLFVYDPIWTVRGAPKPEPSPGASSTGTNARGDYVTVWVDFAYRPIVNLPLIPDITVSAESTLVVNN